LNSLRKVVSRLESILSYKLIKDLYINCSQICKLYTIFEFPVLTRQLSIAGIQKFSNKM